MKKKRIKAKNAQTNAAAVNVKKVSTEPTYSKKLKWGLAVLITVFAFILYSQSIKHNYTLDDHKVVDKNTVTTSGLEGIPTILKRIIGMGPVRITLEGLSIGLCH